MKWIVEEISSLSGYVLKYEVFFDEAQAQSEYERLVEKTKGSDRTTVAIYKKIDNRQLVE